MTLPKSKFKKAPLFLKRLPRKLAEKSFLTFIVLFFASAGIGSLVFYKYSVLPERENPESKEKLLVFNNSVYADVLAVWEERKINFQEAGSNAYLNPFRVNAASAELTK